MHLPSPPPPRPPKGQRLDGQRGLPTMAQQCTPSTPSTVCPGTLPSPGCEGWGGGGGVGVISAERSLLMTKKAAAPPRPRRRKGVNIGDTLCCMVDDDEENCLYTVDNIQEE
eukprot:1333641-Prymnesium_polylepis.1